MKIEISSKVEIDMSLDIYQLGNTLIIRSNEFKELYKKIFEYSNVLRLKTTTYPHVLIKSASGDVFAFSKIIIETHSGSMIDNDSLLINEFNILIEEIENIFKYIKWNLSVI